MYNMGTHWVPVAICPLTDRIPWGGGLHCSAAWLLHAALGCLLLGELSVHGVAWHRAAQLRLVKQCVCVTLFGPQIRLHLPTCIMAHQST